MSRLTRALVVGVTVMAMSLATTAAVAQTHDEHTTGEREAAQGWNDYYQATQVGPAELAARTRAGATRRALAEQWNHYYHATRLAPAEHKAGRRPGS